MLWQRNINKQSLIEIEPHKVFMELTLSFFQVAAGKIELEQIQNQVKSIVFNT